MNEIMKQSEKLMTQLNSIYNQPSYLNLRSAMSNLVMPSIVVNDNMTNYMGNAIKTIAGFGIETVRANDIISGVVQSISKQIMIPNTALLTSLSKTLGNMVSWQTDFFKNNRKFFDRMLFMSIADEIGFPIYMEVDTELQNQLLKSYRKNGNQCNKEEMRQIIIDYYNDGYVDQILNGIQNVGIFNEQRVKLISEGIEV